MTGNEARMKRNTQKARMEFTADMVRDEPSTFRFQLLPRILPLLLHPMPALTSYTKPLTDLQAAKLRTLLEEKGFKFESKPYTLYAASGEKLSIAVYEKGPK